MAIIGETQFLERIQFFNGRAPLHNRTSRRSRPSTARCGGCTTRACISQESAAATP